MNPSFPGIMAVVRRTGGGCLDTPDAVALAYPNVPEDVRASAIVSGAKSPFPSVEGNPPLDRARPFWDGRRIERERIAAGGT